MRCHAISSVITLTCAQPESGSSSSPCGGAVTVGRRSVGPTQAPPKDAGAAGTFGPYVGSGTGRNLNHEQEQGGDHGHPTTPAGVAERLGPWR